MGYFYGDFGFTYGRHYEKGYSDYLKTMMFSSFEYSRLNPAYDWQTKSCISALNCWNLYRAGANADVRVFPGGRTYYHVLESNPITSDFGGSSEDLEKRLEMRAGMASVRVLQGRVGGKLYTARSIRQALNEKHLSEDLKEQVRDLVQRAEEQLEILDAYLANEDNKSIDFVEESIAAMLETAQELENESEALYKECIANIQENNEEADAAAEEKIRSRSRNNGSGTRKAGSASGNATGKFVEDDFEEDTEDSQVKKARYGVDPTASIPACEGADTLASSVEALTDKAGFADLFGKKKSVNEKNVVEVISQVGVSDFVDKLATLKDGEKDYSTKALNEVIKLIEARVDLLNKSGHIDANVKIDVNASVQKLENYKSDVVTNKANIVTELQKVVEALTGLGSEDKVNEAIAAKKNDAEAKAPVEFRKDYAKAKGETFDENATYVAFPEEIKYLPNKQVFQVTINVNGTDYKFEGGNFNAIDKAVSDKVAADSIEGLTEAWNTIKTKLLEVASTT